MPDQEEELESSKQSAALGESKKLSHQLVNGNPLLCLNRECCKTPKSWLDLSIELWNVCRQAVAKFSYVTKLLPKLSSPQPPPAVVCFFEASVLFGIKNAIFCLSLWAIFVILSRMYACFGVGLQAYIIQWGYILDHVNSVNHVNNVNHVNRVRGHAAC